MTNQEYGIPGHQILEALEHLLLQIGLQISNLAIHTTSEGLSKKCFIDYTETGQK